MEHNPFSPLAEVFETTTHPHARTLRTSFKQKLGDTFYALTGSSSPMHVGVFDYFTLYIPTALLVALGWCFANVSTNILAKILIVPITLINIPLIIARLAFAAVTTFLLIPLISLVHGLSQLMPDQSLNKALDLEGELEGQSQTLNKYLLQKDLDLEELDITVQKSSSELENKNIPANSYQLMFKRKVTDSDPDPLPTASFSQSKAPVFSVKINLEKGNGSAQQAKNLHALFERNIGNVVGNIETGKMDEADKQALLSL